MAQLLNILNILFVFLILHRLAHLPALLRHIKPLTRFPCCLPISLPFACLPRACPLPPPPRLFVVPSPCTCCPPLPPLPVPILISSSPPYPSPSHPVPTPALPNLPNLPVILFLPPPHPTRRYITMGSLNAHSRKRIIKLGEPVKA